MRSRGECGSSWGNVRRRSDAVLEAPAFVADLDDVAVMREAVQESGGHLRTAKDGRPFAEGEIGGDDDRGAFVETADQVEQKLPAGLREGEIAKLVEDDEVEAREIVGQPPRTARSALRLEAVDEIDGVEGATPRARADTASRDRVAPGGPGRRRSLPN